jgi:hypothetical protein
MIRDEEVERAIKIGERNKEIIQLANNWCGHLEVEHSGGSDHAVKIFPRILKAGFLNSDAPVWKFSALSSIVITLLRF